jgi:hypothetical protein
MALTLHAGVIHLLKPVPNAGSPIVHMLEVVVAAGQPETIAVEGAGSDTLAAGPVHLGQVLEPLHLLLKDDGGMCPAAELFLCQDNALSIHSQPLQDPEHSVSQLFSILSLFCNPPHANGRTWPAN